MSKPRAKVGSVTYHERYGTVKYEHHPAATSIRAGIAALVEMCAKVEQEGKRLRMISADFRTALEANAERYLVKLAPWLEDVEMHLVLPRTAVFQAAARKLLSMVPEGEDDEEDDPREMVQVQHVTPAATSWTPISSYSSPSRVGITQTRSQ